MIITKIVCDRCSYELSAEERQKHPRVKFINYGSNNMNETEFDLCLRCYCKMVEDLSRKDKR